MKQEFIKKWKSWWMLQKQGAELTDAFERELNILIEQEVASKNLVKADVIGSLPFDFIKSFWSLSDEGIKQLEDAYTIWQKRQ